MSRTPIPWDRIEDPDVSARIALYRELIGLRRTHPALGDGGLRWLHVAPEGVVFVRESADESILVVAVRDDLDIALPAAAVPGAASAVSLFGDATLGVADDGAIVLSAEGPAFAVWSVPGIQPPPATASASAALPQAGGIADAEIAALDADA